MKRYADIRFGAGIVDAMRSDSCVFWIIVVLAASGARAWAAPPFSEVAVGDWYFRESLVAIDDWETILVEREAEVAEADRIPVFPVPDDGSPVAWPNPVPQSLLPSGARDNPVRLQVDVDSIVSL